MEPTTLTKSRRIDQSEDPSGSPRPSTPEPSITTDEDWADTIEGDFEVITSDNVRFHVPSYMLFGAR